MNLKIKSYIFSCLFIWFTATGSPAIPIDQISLSITPYQHGQKPIDTPDRTNTFSLKRVIDQTLAQGFESREKAERVYQAKKFVETKIGALLPAINFGTMVAAVQQNVFEAIPSFVGYLFPSKWFNWQESKMFAKAELYSYKTLLANQVNLIQSLYLNIHLQQSNQRIVQHYLKLVSEVIKYLEYQKNSFQRKITEEHLGFLKNIKARFSFRHSALQNTIDELKPQLAMLFNYKGDWSRLDIDALELEDLSQKTKVESVAFLPAVLMQSSELQTLEYIYKGAKAGKNTRYFDFLEPGSNSLGYGYTSRIKIAKSEMEIIRIREEKTIAELKLALINTINNLNTSIQFFNDSMEERDGIAGPQQALEDHLCSTRPLNLEKIQRFFDYAFEADIQINASKHLYLSARTKLDRLLWKGGFYKDLAQLVPENKKPKIFSKKWFSKKSRTKHREE